MKKRASRLVKRTMEHISSNMSSNPQTPTHGRSPAYKYKKRGEKRPEIQDQTNCSASRPLSSRNSPPLPPASLSPASFPPPSAMDGAACCKCGGASNPGQLLHCFRCHRLQHISCCPDIKRYGCCDACLLEAEFREEQVPSWVRDLAAVDFSALCRKNRFCPTCLAGFSGPRCPTAHQHAGGQGADAIEIHMLGEGDSLRTFVDVTEVDGLYERSEIQLEMDLVPQPRQLRELVPLHPGKGCAKYCGSIRIGDERLYCSMRCKVHWQENKLKGRLCNQFIKALLVEDFTSGYQQDAFCIPCRVAFCTSLHRDHVDHPCVDMISITGWMFVRVLGTEKWLGNFAFVPDEGTGYRLLPLTPPTQNSCECGNLRGYHWYCSLGCMVKKYHLPARSPTEAKTQDCSRKMEAPAYLEAFLNQDFWHTCRQDSYCFSCGVAFCRKCCPCHAAKHHPGQQLVRIAKVKTVRHYVAIDTDDAIGVGYDWRGIQRIRDGRSSYIPLRRAGVLPGHGKPLDCSKCGDRTYLSCLYCCAKCRVESVLTGRGRPMAKALVVTEFQLNLLPDRFCTKCHQLFSSACCGNHTIVHHHTGHLIQIVRHQRMILSPIEDLIGFSDDSLVYVQKVQVNGATLVPVCTSEEPPGGEPGSICAYCFLTIGVEYNYCSL